MKKIIGAIVIILAVCVLSVFRPNTTKAIGKKTVQVIDWTYSKVKSGVNFCFSKAEKMDLKKSTN